MRKKIIYSLSSPHRENMDVIGYYFGQGSKSVCIMGALRGNEVQQMYVCSQLIQRLKKLEAEGAITSGHEILVVPCVNYYSMNIGKRFWTMDNTDINRMFPGYDLGETTQRIAAGIFEQITGYEYGIQLASFYQQGDFIPHVKVMDTGFVDPELLKCFGLPYAFVRKPKPYDTTTLNYNWQIWETKAFSLFSGTTDVIDQKCADIAVEAIIRFMKNSGIINTVIHSGYITEVIHEENNVQMHASCSGIFRPLKTAGDDIVRGEPVCEILHPLEGNVICTLNAPCDGLIYFCFNQPLIIEKTVIFKIIRKQ
ncbi:MAG: M14 family metallopeptidase [Huintestinicola sp.]